MIYGSKFEPVLWKSEVFLKTECWNKDYSNKIIINIQFTSRNNKVKMKMMHGVNMDKMDKPSLKIMLCCMRQANLAEILCSLT
jgi:hypothetical protein